MPKLVKLQIRMPRALRDELKIEAVRRRKSMAAIAVERLQNYHVVSTGTVGGEGGGH